MIISIMYVNYLKYNDLWRYIYKSLRIKWFFELKFDLLFSFVIGNVIKISYNIN